MSLDLSWSGYTEHYALVDALSRLPHLRNLVLEGNPLTLTTLYPGFTLDSLVHLLYLDGNQITPDDRHRFSGLAQLRGNIIVFLLFLYVFKLCLANVGSNIKFGTYKNTQI